MVYILDSQREDFGVVAWKDLGMAVRNEFRTFGTPGLEEGFDLWPINPLQRLFVGW